MYRRVEDLATSLLPPQFVQDCTISVQEVQCGDPTCAPIDTIITLLFGRYAGRCVRAEERRSSRFALPGLGGPSLCAAFQLPTD